MKHKVKDEYAYYVFENKRKPGTYICDENLINPDSLLASQSLEKVSPSEYSPHYYITTTEKSMAKMFTSKWKAFWYSLNLTFDYKITKIYLIPQYEV